MKELSFALEEIAVRFLTNITDYDLKYPERLYFILEEAHWFYIDYIRKKYKLDKMDFKEFKSQILDIVGLKDYYDHPFYINNFGNYKNNIPVYGGIIFNRDMDHLLLVNGFTKNSQYFFPRGKKNFGENGRECAIREINEEIGLDVSKKISYEIFIDNRTCLYVILNVDMNFKFKTNTKCEIRNIKWFSIPKIISGKYNGLDRVNRIYSLIADKIEEIKKVCVKFDEKRIAKVFDEIC